MTEKLEVKSLDELGLPSLDDRILKFQLEDALLVLTPKDIRRLAHDSDLIRVLLENQKDDIELRLSLTQSEWIFINDHYGLIYRDKDLRLTSRARLLIAAYYLGASTLISNLSSSFLLYKDEEVINYQELDNVYHIITDKNHLLKIEGLDRLLFVSIKVEHTLLFRFIFDQLSFSKQSKVIEYMIRLQYNNLLIDSVKSSLLCLNHLKNAITHNNIFIFQYIIDNYESSAKSTIIMSVQSYIHKLQRREMLLYIFDKIAINFDSIFIFVPLIKESPSLLQKMIDRKDFIDVVQSRNFNISRLTTQIILSSNDNLELFKLYESFCRELKIELKLDDKNFGLNDNSDDDSNSNESDHFPLGWFDTALFLASKNEPSIPKIDMKLYPSIFRYILQNYIHNINDINLANSSSEIVDILREKSNHLSFANFLEQDIDETKIQDPEKWTYPIDDFSLTRHYGYEISQYSIYREYCSYDDYSKDNIGGMIADGNDMVNVPEEPEPEEDIIPNHIDLMIDNIDPQLSDDADEKTVDDVLTNDLLEQNIDEKTAHEPINDTTDEKSATEINPIMSTVKSLTS